MSSGQALKPAGKGLQPVPHRRMGIGVVHVSDVTHVPNEILSDKVWQHLATTSQKTLRRCPTESKWGSNYQILWVSVVSPSSPSAFRIDILWRDVLQKVLDGCEV